MGDDGVDAAVDQQLVRGVLGGGDVPLDPRRQPVRHLLFTANISGRAKGKEETKIHAEGKKVWDGADLDEAEGDDEHGRLEAE